MNPLQPEIKQGTKCQWYHFERPKYEEGWYHGYFVAWGIRNNSTSVLVVPEWRLEAVENIELIDVEFRDWKDKE